MLAVLQVTGGNTMGSAAESTMHSPEHVTQVDERELGSGPGIAVLIGSLAAYLAGILLARAGGVAEIWTAVGLFVLGTGGLAGLTAIKPGEVPRRPALRRLPGNGAHDRIALGEPLRHSPTGLGEDPQQGDPDGEGQRCRRQPHRDRRRRRMAGARHRPCDLRGRGLRRLRQYPERGRALRHVANGHPYDNAGSDALSLRDHTDEVAGQLATEIAARVVPAGVDVIEARITRLSYAPEIAQVMLQRQQAGAVIAARSRIVDGAVGMVQMALARLADEGIVELDEERKAAMVSNLLVVLCGDRGTQPIVNTGSLYQ